ncbi:hypothetical protein LINPERPRIM_LOCUS35790 [Linum perenne]
MAGLVKFLQKLFPTLDDSNSSDFSSWWDISQRLWGNAGQHNNNNNNNNNSSSCSNSPSVTVDDHEEAEQVIALVEHLHDHGEMEEEEEEEEYDDDDGQEEDDDDDDEEEDECSDEEVVSWCPTWRCYLCHLTATSSGETFNSHLRGKRHRLNLMNQLKIKSSMISVFDGRSPYHHDGGTSTCASPSSSVLVRRTGSATWQCKVCDVSCSGKASMVDHLLGKKHYAVFRNNQDH